MRIVDSPNHDERPPGTEITLVVLHSISLPPGEYGGEAILQALGKTGFNRTAAARLLGITFRQLRYRMQRLSIKDENR